MEWYEIVISILSGLAVTIPLVVKLVEYVKKVVQEQKWGNLLSLVMRLMAEAEEKFDNGATKKQWVIDMVAASGDVVDYKIDAEQLGNLIDSLCALTKKVNTPKVVSE